MKKIFLFSIAILISTQFYGQRNPSNDEIFISGFEQLIEADRIQYSSGIEGLNEALITRAGTGKQRMIWKTAKVENKADSKKITFVNYIGYDSRKPGAIFNVFVNQKNIGRIELPDPKLDEWSLSFDNKAEMHFKKHFTDGNGDVFGFLYYSLPAKSVKKGSSLEFEITGAQENELTWMMVFKKDFTESLTLESLPAIQETESGKFQTLIAEVNYLDEPALTQVYVNDELTKEIELESGIQAIELLIPLVDRETEVRVRLVNPNTELKANAIVKPVKKWKVNFVQHSHTDIGYTRSQMEILAEHLRYIDYALDYCDATDDYPDESKFRWSCEASWAVDVYLNSRSKKQIDRLKKRISEGRIEVTGMYFNFSELPDEQSLAASLAPLKRISEKGIPVTSAMQNDVNGIGWCMNDYFNTLDVRYLNMGTHGHKALISFDTPLAFWWVSPSGKKMLAFRAEHYMIGNTAFGVHLEDFEYFERSMLKYLNQLKERDYPYDHVAIQHSGFLTDNSPPSLMSSKLIRQWNDKYQWPKIKTAVVSEFFQDIEEKYGDDLIEIQAHWPDWWSDGIASAAREVAASRDAHASLIAGQGGLAMAKLMGSDMPKGIEDRFWETNKALLFFGEHTFGAAESISSPYSQTTMEQREIKESYAWEANRRAKTINEEALGLLIDHTGSDQAPSLVVFNTLTWERDGLVTLYIDHEQIPIGSEMQLVEEDGTVIPAQIAQPWHGGSYWSAWVSDIPSFGFKKYKIEVLENDHGHSHGSGSHEHSNSLTGYSEKGDIIQIENQWYNLTIDKKKAAIKQINDRELGQNLLDEASEYQLGEFILEKLGGREQLQSSMEPNGSRYGHLTDYTREPLDSIWLSQIEEGKLWTSVIFKGKTGTAYEEEGFEFELKLFKVSKRIDFVFNLKKKPILSPESFYIAFPFHLDKAKIHAEIAGGIMQAGVDQLPGSANDWNTIQNFVQIKNEQEQIILVSPEAPMIQFGNINTGRFEYGAEPESNHLFSWPMNNYWTTNFNADQRGMYNWTYQLTSLANNKSEDAVRFGWGGRIPFLARVLPAGIKQTNTDKERSILSAVADNVLLINAKPLEDENAILFHFREVGGKQARFLPQIDGLSGLKWHEANVLGEESKACEVLTIEALESKFFKLSWD